MALYTTHLSLSIELVFSQLTLVFRGELKKRRCLNKKTHIAIYYQIVQRYIKHRKSLFSFVTRTEYIFFEQIYPDLYPMYRRINETDH